MKTEEKSVNNKKLIPFWVIERALEGDIQAINKILNIMKDILQNYRSEKCMMSMAVFIIV